MKALMIAVAVALLATASIGNAQEQRTERTEQRRVETHERAHRGDRHEHRRFVGNRGERGRFWGWPGTFNGEVIVLDDGCYVWNGFEWEVDVGCE